MRLETVKEGGCAVRNEKRGYFCILLAAVIFSTTEVALKVLSGSFAPMQLTVERVLIGGLSTLPFALREKKRRDLRFTTSDWRYFALLGFLTVLVHMTLLQMAVLHADASATAIIYSGNPIFAVFFAHLILRERIERNHLAAVALEVVGILVLLNPPHLEMSLRGFLEILGATVCFSCYGVLCKLRVERLGSTVIASMNMLVGGTEMLALLLLGKIEPVAQIYERLGLSIFARVPLTEGFTPATTLTLLYVGIVVAGGGFFLTGQIAKDTSATEASFMYLLKPIFATFVAAAVLHEHISAHRIAGILIFTLASLCVFLPVLRALWRERKAAKT